jgi:hypothetical protein
MDVPATVFGRGGCHQLWDTAQCAQGGSTMDAICGEMPAVPNYRGLLIALLRYQAGHSASQRLRHRTGFAGHCAGCCLCNQRVLSQRCGVDAWAQALANVQQGTYVATSGCGNPLRALPQVKRLVECGDC